MKSVKQKIVLGSFIDIFGTILATVVSFAVIRLYFQVITKDEFGLWLAINGVASLIALVDLGVDQYFTTLIASDKTFFEKKFNIELSNAIVIKLCVAFFFLIIGLLMFFFLPKIIDIDPKFLLIARTTFLINTAYLILNIFFNSANTILAGRNHFSLVNSLTVCSAISASVLTYFLLKLNYGIKSFPLALLITAVFQFFIMVFLIRKKYPHIGFGKINLRDRKDMISYSFSFQLLRWSHIIRTQYIVIAINNYAGPAFVAIYNMTNKIPSMAPAYFSKLVMPFFPSFSRYVAENDFESIGKIVIKLTKVLFRFAILFSISIALFNRSFVTLWVGADNYTGMASEMWIILYMFAFSAFCGFGIIIYSTKKFEKWTILSIVEIFVVIILSYILNKYYGFVGIIAGFVLGSIFTQFYIAHISLNQINLTIPNVINRIYKYVLIPNVLSALVGLIMYKYLSFDSWKSLIGDGILFLFLHFLFFEGFKILISKEPGVKKRIIESFSV